MRPWWNLMQVSVWFYLTLRVRNESACFPQRDVIGKCGLFWHLCGNWSQRPCSSCPLYKHLSLYSRQPIKAMWRWDAPYFETYVDCDPRLPRAMTCTFRAQFIYFLFSLIFWSRRWCGTFPRNRSNVYSSSLPFFHNHSLRTLVARPQLKYLLRGLFPSVCLL